MIYLDNAATTKPSVTALNRADKFNNEAFFNPSAMYAGGLNSAVEIKKAKDSILKNLSAIKHEVIFTSCGTESDNLAVFCAVKRGTFVTDEGEHAAIYKSFLELKNRGLNVNFIPLDKFGAVDKEKLYSFVKENNVDFVSIMHVNNETGAVNDINEIAKTLKSINQKLIFHADGVQAYGKIPYAISQDIDLYSISAHKINALKGTGTLIKKKGLNLSPLLFGGGQENGYRSGTENLFGIKVFEYAGEEHYKNIKDNYRKVLELKTLLLNNLNNKYFQIISGENSSPYILSISAIGLKGEVVMHSLEKFGIVVGNGSACSSKKPFSRVIEACGYDRKVLDGVIRISFSAENTAEEIEFFTDKINKTVEKLKEIMR